MIFLAVRRYAAASYTALLGVIFGSVFMSVTGGGLKAYELRELTALANGQAPPAVVRVVRFEKRARLETRSPVSLDPAVVLLGGDLLGGRVQETHFFLVANEPLSAPLGRERDPRPETRVEACGEACMGKALIVAPLAPLDLLAEAPEPIALDAVS